MKKYFWSRIRPFAVLYLAINTLVRLAFLARVGEQFELPVLQSIMVMAIGFLSDVSVLAVFLCIWLFFLTLLPHRHHGAKIDKIFTYVGFGIFAAVLVFGAISEWLFWDEFYVRFNFIAVDYLIYTQEVIGNIQESYPLPVIFAGIGAIAALTVWIFRRSLEIYEAPMHGLKHRLAVFGVSVLFAAIGCALTHNLYQSVKDENLQEVAKNGPMSFVEAFLDNELDYHKFYSTAPEETVNQTVRGILKENHSEYVSPSGPDITRKISHPGAEIRKNVVFIVMESMSGNYMQTFGSKDNITPNLDALTKESLFFSNLYATGTRTVRGLEAVTLSIPPTPGQSIIRRPGNENLYSLGFIFKDRGYDTKFFYGGYGYFDNMNAFFSTNGFDILDRSSFAPEEIQFANVWGICDEDVMNRMLREASKSYEIKKPFLYLMMTTSNHRPYTYPEGRIDIPPKSSRHGGVKYADFAVGDFIKKAKDQPWFKDTVFVFISDHTAGSAGKIDLDPIKYHIPAMIYAPGFVTPREYSALASQIDIAPTLLGMLNFSYYSKFYGDDVLRGEHIVPRAFISNYQKVGLLTNDNLTILEPKRTVVEYSVAKDDAVFSETIRGKVFKEAKIDPTRRLDAVSLIQSASEWKDRYGRVPTVVK